ncbi:predicted RNA-binding protein [Pseudozyma hubeiensis SY62]|uniref:Predicted RNA-binding protein n=1 Tax=Pseudozyma hubeiensis (strain SY62) TaxID=1305764 RepID=R9NVT8_PSEHS|nr:predicted RNA-binding protein [Pseudozyma hubeiensis SY62]GAC92546.1 predicted RNA-binding protein [Pseudozyma hubeiensis SY62]
MRAFFPALLLNLLVVVWPASTLGHSSSVTLHGHPPLTKQLHTQTARRLLDTEVPDRLKSLGVFQDGNRVREGIRSAYTKVLRQVDKVKEPYSFSEGIQKEWIYQPDLRKHYFVPRVLRLPALLQQGPIPHEQAFTAFLKSTDEEFGLKDVAVTHVPELSDFKPAENVPVKVTDTPEAADPRSDESGPSNSRYRRRRSRKAYRTQNFNNFEAGPHTPTTLRAMPDNEIESDRTWPIRGPVPPETEPDLGESSKQMRPQQAASRGEVRFGRRIPADRLSNTLVAMDERFKVMRKFQQTQIEKASMRYVGHPQYRPPLQQKGQEVAAGAPPGLAPIRTKPVASQKVSPDPTPRDAVDPAGTEADASNPATPNYDFGDSFTPNGPYFKHDPRDASESNTPLGDPSPIVSPDGGMTPSSRASTTPNTPEKFRLPVDYDQLLHQARMRHGQVPAYRPVSKPLDVFSESVPAHANKKPDSGWNHGPTSGEALREFKDLAKWHGVDHAIDQHDSLPEGTRHVPVRSDKMHGYDDDSQAPDKTSPSGKRKSPLYAGTVKSPQRGSRAPAHQQTDQNFENIEAAPSALSEPQMNNVEMKDTLSTDNGPGQQETDHSNALPPEAPAKKRKQPILGLVKPMMRVPSFGFPISGADPTSPYLEGFKPSLRTEVDPTAQSNPTVPLDANQESREAAGRLESLQDTLKRLPFSGSREAVIQAFQEHRLPKPLPRESSDRRSSIFTP